MDRPQTQTGLGPPPILGALLGSGVRARAVCSCQGEASLARDEHYFQSKTKQNLIITLFTDLTDIVCLLNKHTQHDTEPKPDASTGNARNFVCGAL